MSALQLRLSDAATRQDPQICFGIAATGGHDADLVWFFERSLHPDFVWPRGGQASPRCADGKAKLHSSGYQGSTLNYMRKQMSGLIGTVPCAPHWSRARNFSKKGSNGS